MCVCVLCVCVCIANDTVAQQQSALRFQVLAWHGQWWTKNIHDFFASSLNGSLKRHWDQFHAKDFPAKEGNLRWVHNNRFWPTRRGTQEEKKTQHNAIKKPNESDKRTKSYTEHATSRSWVDQHKIGNKAMMRRIPEPAKKKKDAKQRQDD